jgi:hypothetical protein
MWGRGESCTQLAENMFKEGCGEAFKHSINTTMGNISYALVSSGFVFGIALSAFTSPFSLTTWKFTVTNPYHSKQYVRRGIRSTQEVCKHYAIIVP